MIDSPFLEKDRAHWPLVTVIGITSVGMAVLGIGFGFASYTLSGGQITEDQRPDRSAIVDWPIITPPALMTIAAAVLAVVAIIVLATRTTVRTAGTLVTAFGWALAGMLGALALASAFPRARIGSVAMVPGFSDHAVGVGIFALAALATFLGQRSVSRATKAARAAGLNPAFLPIVPPQGTSLVPGLHIEAPPMWRWTPRDGVPAIVPEEHRPAPLLITVLDGDPGPVVDPMPVEAMVGDAAARRETITEASGETLLRYRYSPPAGAAERVVEMRIRPTANRHELRAYIDCADLIAGSVRWHAPAAEPVRKRRWWARS